MFFDEIKPTNFFFGFFDSRAKFKSNTFSPCRDCKQYEIEFFTEDGGVAYVNNDEYEIKKDHILFVKPGEKRRSKLHFKCLYLHIQICDPEFIKYLSEIPTYFSVSHKNYYCSAFHKLIVLQKAKDFESRCLFTISVADLIISIHKDAHLYNDMSKSDVIYNAKKYITDHFSEKIDLNTIASFVHLSPNYFQKLFTQKCGISPHDFLMDKRLSRAKYLLTSTNTDILQISILSGFSSQSYFNYYFKSKTGLSPLGYRKKEIEKYIK